MRFLFQFLPVMIVIGSIATAYMKPEKRKIFGLLLIIGLTTMLTAWVDQRNSLHAQAEKVAQKYYFTFAEIDVGNRSGMSHRTRPVCGPSKPIPVDTSIVQYFERHPKHTRLAYVNHKHQCGVCIVNSPGQYACDEGMVVGWEASS